jgi:hypothetical protein
VCLNTCCSGTAEEGNGVPACKNPEIDGMPRFKNCVTLLSGEKNEKTICVELKQPYGGSPA